MNETTKINLIHTVQGVVIGAVLTGLSYLVANWAGWAPLNALNWVEAFAVFTSYVCTYLCVFQTRWNYPIGVISTFAFSILFWQFGLFSLAIFNMYLVLSLAYGWFRWGNDEDTRPVDLVNGWAYLGYIFLAFIIYGLLWSINTIMGNEMGLTDVLLAVASGVAQFLLDNKKLENWILWIVIDIVSIWLFFNTGLFITMFQYFFFLLNAIWAFFVWKKTMIPDSDEFEEYIKEEFLFHDKPKEILITA